MSMNSDQFIRWLQGQPKPEATGRRLAGKWIKLAVPGEYSLLPNYRWTCVVSTTGLAPHCMESAVYVDEGGSGHAACAAHAKLMDVFEPAAPAKTWVDFVAAPGASPYRCHQTNGKQVRASMDGKAWILMPSHLGAPPLPPVEAKAGTGNAVDSRCVKCSGVHAEVACPPGWHGSDSASCTAPEWCGLRHFSASDDDPDDPAIYWVVQRYGPALGFCSQSCANAKQAAKSEKSPVVASPVGAGADALSAPVAAPGGEKRGTIPWHCRGVNKDIPCTTPNAPREYQAPASSGRNDYCVVCADKLVAVATGIMNARAREAVRHSERPTFPSPPGGASIGGVVPGSGRFGTWQ